MSAYIVEKKHIVYLVAAAMSKRIVPYGSLSWSWKDPATADQTMRDELGKSDHEKAAEVANMLWRENMASVDSRYSGGSSAGLPGGGSGDYTVTPRDLAAGEIFQDFDPVQVIKSCHCFTYQSCEHEAWENSPARSFIEALLHSATHSLPGYDDAAWGAPESAGKCSRRAAPSRVWGALSRLKEL